MILLKSEFGVYFYECDCEAAMISNSTVTLLFIT